MTRKKSGDPALQAQFPRDPNRAAEAGFTTGEAGPEKPGHRMQTPEKISHKLPADLRAESRAEAERQRAKTSKEAKLTAAFVSEAEKIGPQGNIDQGNIDQGDIDR